MEHNQDKNAEITRITQEIDSLTKEFHKQARQLADFYLHFDHWHWLSMFDDDHAYLRDMSAFDFFNHVFKQYNNEFEQRFYDTVNALKEQRKALGGAELISDDEVHF